MLPYSMSIGKVEFLPTDNDRKVTGHQNQRLLELDYWKYQYRELPALPWRELTNRMNQGPVKMSKKDYSFGIKEMKQKLQEM